MTDTQKILKDLANAKAVFQLRAIAAAMCITEVECPVCGDSHPNDSIPFTCESGDGQ